MKLLAWLRRRQRQDPKPRYWVNGHGPLDSPQERDRMHRMLSWVAERNRRAERLGTRPDKPVCPACGSTRIHVDYVEVSESITGPVVKIPSRRECLDCSGSGQRH